MFYVPHEIHFERQNYDEENYIKTKPIEKCTTPDVNNNNNNNIMVVAEKQATQEEQEEKKPLFILEPAVLLVYFAMNLYSTVFQNQLLYQSCTTIFHYSAEDCEPLLGIKKNTNASKQIETIVQPYVANITMARSLIESLIPAVMSLFVGPWSDKFGRRPIILITFIGYFIDFVISTIMTGVSLNTEFTPWLYLIPSVSLALTGGSCCMMTVIFCYITDIAPARHRGLCLVLNRSAMGIGTFVGSLTGSYLFAATNMAVLFSVSAFCMILAFLYVIFFAKECVTVLDERFQVKIREFFHYDRIVDLVRTCFLKRRSHERAYLWLIILSLVFTSFVALGESNVVYFFVRTKFNVTLSQYTIYDVVATVIQMAGGVLGTVVLRKHLNFSFNTLALLSLTCCLLHSIACAAAMKFWELYFAAVLDLLGSIVSPMLLAMLSLAIPSSEIGKVFGITTALQTVTALGATPLYTAVYDATLTFYPGMFNIISAVLYLICLIFIGTIFGVRRFLHETLQ